MKKLLTPILLVAAIFAGSAGASFLKGGSSDAGSVKEHADEGKEDSHGKDDHGDKSHDDGHGKKDDKHAKGKDSHGKDSHGKDSHGGSDVIFYKFSREFVIPLMREEAVESLVILNINLEVDSSMSSSLFGMDPKLRDNIMTTLISLSNDGVTLNRVSDVNNYETIRGMVLDNLKKEVGEGIKNVLILDMAIQEL